MQTPAALVAGDRVSIVAPSSPFPRDRFLGGLAWLAGRYTIQLRSDIFAKNGYLAGSDERRLAELQAALDADETKAIFAARGGYGATRLLAQLDWTKFRSNPKWLVGFSDITALHLQCQAFRICSLHAANVTGLALQSSSARSALMRTLEGTCFSASVQGLTALRESMLRDTAVATGSLFGGNLSLLVSEAAAQRLHVPDDAIWILEDVTERPYRVDRMLISLLPFLVRARAIVFGEFSQCLPGPDHVTTTDVLREFAQRLPTSCPVYAADWFGHGEENPPLVLGSRATLHAGALHMRW
jgi:muramoyltetrapeptide carboxypeptidase